MNHIVCGPEVVALLNLMSTSIPKKNTKNEQKSNFMDNQIKIAEDSIQNELFNQKATEYFEKC